MNRKYTIYLLAAIAISGCGSNSASSSQATDTAKKEAVTVDFNADSAYSFVKRQTDFGPRVPGSEAHRLCADWLADKLRSYGGQVTEQSIELKAYDGTRLPARNISAAFNPDADKRILLLSHWDSRPWADQEKDPAQRNKPIDGANDGASGVGVILEIARNIAAKSPKIGVDVLMVDAEDYGTRSDDTVNDSETSWCLGSQYWAANPTIDLSKTRYAILLDMVGGKGAVFPREYFSERYASNINDKIWRMAQQSGYADRFVNDTGTPVIDDHLPLLRAGVQAIDIIETNNPATNSFNPTWHTHADNIDNIDPATLKAVGQTLQNLIYNE